MEQLKQAITLEIRAAEGGADAALLVETMYGAYVKAATRYCL